MKRYRWKLAAGTESDRLSYTIGALVALGDTAESFRVSVCPETWNLLSRTPGFRRHEERPELVYSLSGRMVYVTGQNPDPEIFSVGNENAVVVDSGIKLYSEQEQNWHLSELEPIEEP